MKIQWTKILKAIALPLAVGASSARITMDAMKSFDSLNKPPLSPPAWLFPIAWSILYVLMGIASYLVSVSDKEARAKTALTVYGIQLFFNFFWSIIFFSFEAYLLAFIWLVLLWILIIVTAYLFYGINKTAGYLMIPYILWVTFAGYLNLAIYLLN